MELPPDLLKIGLHPAVTREPRENWNKEASSVHVSRSYIRTKHTLLIPGTVDYS